MCVCVLLGFFVFVCLFFLKGRGEKKKKKTLPVLAKSVTFSISEILVVWEFLLNVSVVVVVVFAFLYIVLLES